MNEVKDAPDLQMLRQLLKKRLEVIWDHNLRDRDPEGHLQALKDVSLKISKLHQEWRPALAPRLNHFLSQASFSKALEWIETEGAPPQL